MSEATDVVQIETGLISGIAGTDMLSFLGIPFAAPPVGPLRWMPPEPAARWEGVRECTSYGSDSQQTADLGVFARAGGSEDCLYLNVFVPRRSTVSHAKLPVMVWIHGGAARVGTPRDYDPTWLVDRGGVILVSINYRLGILGNFVHPDLEKQGQALGNFGLRDQQMALAWIRRNIEAFGGDAANVTIFGESSGANSSIAHLVSPQSAGLFDQAIVMSGGAMILKPLVFGAPVPIEIARQNGLDFAAAAGADSLAQLREIPAEDLLAVQGPYVSTNQLFFDGQTIPIHPAEAFRTGQFNRVPAIFGHTAGEGAFFAGLMENLSGLPMTTEACESEIAALFGDLTLRVLAEYGEGLFDSPAERFAAVFTDYMFACTDKIIMGWAGKYAPVYGYEFNDKTAPTYLLPTTFPQGAGHTLELPYLFKEFHGGEGVPTRLNGLQEKLSEQMIKYWTSLSRAGTDDWDWPTFNPAEDNFMMLQLPEARVVAGRHQSRHHHGFWEGLGIYG